MNKFCFTVEGPLVGYQRPGDKGHRYKRYTQYKNRVLLAAMEKGWRGRAVSLKENPPTLSIFVQWIRNPRIDFSNVLKGIEDSLFSQDRFVKPGKFALAWDVGIEAVSVTVECE